AIRDYPLTAERYFREKGRTLPYAGFIKNRVRTRLSHLARSVKRERKRQTPNNRQVHETPDVSTIAGAGKSPPAEGLPDAVKEAIATLPERQRKVIELDLASRSDEEIAAELDTIEGNVRTLRSRAEENLRKACNKARTTGRLFL